MTDEATEETEDEPEEVIRYARYRPMDDSVDNLCRWQPIDDFKDVQDDAMRQASIGAGDEASDIILTYVGDVALPVLCAPDSVHGYTYAELRAAASLWLEVEGVGAVVERFKPRDPNDRRTLTDDEWRAAMARFTNGANPRAWDLARRDLETDRAVMLSTISKLETTLEGATLALGER